VNTELTLRRVPVSCDEGVTEKTRECKDGVWCRLNLSYKVDIDQSSESYAMAQCPSKRLKSSYKVNTADFEGLRLSSFFLILSFWFPTDCCES